MAKSAMEATPTPEDAGGGWQPVPHPLDEAKRLASLLALDVLDTDPEESFDRITRLASHLLEMPMALVSLVDTDRQWFKSRVGLDAAETPRDVAFCAHAILGPETLVVPDAHVDPRFADNPLVRGEPRVRFYAGAPLTLEDGSRVGTLCVIDQKPRQLTPEDAAALEDLAKIVVDELRLRSKLVEVTAATRALQIANENLEQFAHAASHDLRAPLKTATNLCDLLVSEADGEQPMLDMLRETVVHMEALVAGYRRLSKLRLDEAEPCRLGELLSAIDTDVAIRLHHEVELFGDRALLQQLLVNLVDNAARYGTDRTLDVVAHANDERVTISVSNPIAASIQVDRSVFSPFKRLTSEGDGTGLGLSIVERIVRMHGGDVSASGLGGRFTVELTLPYDRASP